MNQTMFIDMECLCNEFLERTRIWLATCNVCLMSFRNQNMFIDKRCLCNEFKEPAYGY